jgi:hypothetical protein
MPAVIRTKAANRPIANIAQSKIAKGKNAPIAAQKANA